MPCLPRRFLEGVEHTHTPKHVDYTRLPFLPSLTYHSTRCQFPPGKFYVPTMYTFPTVLMEEKKKKGVDRQLPFPRPYLFLWNLEPSHELGLLGFCCLQVGATYEPAVGRTAVQLHTHTQIWFLLQTGYYHLPPRPSAVPQHHPYVV